MKPNGKREESRPAHGNSGVIPTLCVITQRNNLFRGCLELPHHPDAIS